jgi:hypothetical protein
MMWSEFLKSCLPAGAMPDADLLVRVLLETALISTLSNEQWDLLIRQGRRANLLGKLAFRLSSDGVMPQVPAAPQRHLCSALKMVERQDLAIRWEVSRISAALSSAGMDFILLKGASYIMARLPCSRGRTFSDVDILVPKERIRDAESALMIHGWQGSHHDEYDQHYYRKWMHEIPPMMHVRRGTTIDVHHTILPETARIKVNTAALISNPMQVEGFDNVFTLAPIDMVIHSATHLFHEGELENGLRDLFDLDSMFRHFAAEEGFWEGLLPRSRELGLERPFFYAVFFSRQILSTPFPDALLNQVSTISPPMLVRRLMTACYGRALRPNHSSTHTRGTWLARKALYIRSHWLRMPMHLLVMHLAHKTFLSRKNESFELSQQEKAKRR